jgi:asparagine synthase (glutamine-hydrolysing)
MCGIIGISGTFLEADLDKATLKLSHRGPDDSGIYFNEDKKIGLGHTRLAIIDLSPLGHQPMISEDKSVILVFNGEIYNFQSLRLDLENKGYKFIGTSDTEVILNMYIEFGINFLKKLNGIFSLAIFDKNTDELFIVRDALGVKPLYYFHNDVSFCFSSEIKALIHLIRDDLSIDYDSIQKYLTFLWCPGNGTPVSSIKKVLPGELIKIKKGKIVSKETWYISPQTKFLPKITNKIEAVNKVTRALSSAVERQLVADVPVGSFLSGGLDSSAIVAFAKEHVPNLHCYTIEPEGGSDDDVAEDLPYARQVAKHLNVDLEVVKINSDNLANDLEEMIWHLDEPLADPAPLNVLYISKLAKKRGMKVLLSGSGGDDLFTGYRRHLALRYESLWSWLPEKQRNGLENFSLKFDQSKTIGRRLGRLFNNAGASSEQRLASCFAWARRKDLEALYSEEMRNATKFNDPNEIIFNYIKTIDSNVSPIDKLLALEQRFFLADHNLIYTDKMSMAAGVEVRVPFLDLELVNLASRIPDNFKQRGRVGKWILKKAMEPYLPNNIIYRPKTGFGAPLRRWIRHDLRSMVDDLLSENSVRNRGLFNHKNVTKMIADNDSGKRDSAYTIFSLLTIEIWCRKFIDDKV